MQLVQKQFNGGLSVTVEETRIDASVAVQFKDSVREIFSNESGRAMLDLKNVEFIDSSGLGALVAVMKTLPKGRKLELVGLTPIVEKVVRLTRMDKVFIIHAGMAEAIRNGQSAA